MLSFWLVFVGLLLVNNFQEGRHEVLDYIFFSHLNQIAPCMAGVLVSFAAGEWRVLRSGRAPDDEAHLNTSAAQRGRLFFFESLKSSGDTSCWFHDFFSLNFISIFFGKMSRHFDLRIFCRLKPPTRILQPGKTKSKGPLK